MLINQQADNDRSDNRGSNIAPFKSADISICYKFLNMLCDKGKEPRNETQLMHSQVYLQSSLVTGDRSSDCF